MKQTSSLEIRRLIAICDEQIRLGRIEEARNILLSISPKRLNDEDRVSIAELCRRSALFNFGLRILAPTVRTDSGVRPESSSLERATYAALLIKLGSIDEALQILAQIPDSSAEAHLYSAYAHIAQWDYVSAAPRLERYIETTGVPEYQRTVGQVNLAAAYVAMNDVSQADKLLAALRQKTLSSGWQLLFKNALDLSASLAVSQSDYSAALSFLNQASHEGQVAKDDLLISKLKALIAVENSGASPASLRELALVRRKAQDISHWETVRDCDYHLALATRDLELLQQVYFGTPFAGFRTRLLNASSDWAVVANDYLWRIGGQAASGSASEQTRVFSIREGQEEGSDIQLKPGQVQYRLFTALLSDFYRPLLIGTVHARVFPGDFYNPITSPQRINNVAYRLRTWLKQNAVPAQIAVRSNQFALNWTSTYSIRIADQNQSVNLYSELKTDLSIAKLKQFWPASGFTSREAAAKLGTSVRTAVAILQSAQTRNAIYRIGNGPSTHYSFAPPNSSTTRTAA